MVEQIFANKTKNEQVLKLREIVNVEKPENPWDVAWQRGVTPWDYGKVQPPLREYFESADGQALVAKLPAGAKALVPGCGKGYDVGYLAGLGYDAWGLDLSPVAVEKAKEWASTLDKEVQARTSYHTLDFFTDSIGDELFDVVYDYTFFCAIPHELREPWGARMRALVKPGGRLVGLVYPIDGDRTGGPPYSVSIVAVEAALGSGWKKVVEFVPKVSSEGNAGRERLVVWERLPSAGTDKL